MTQTERIAIMIIERDLADLKLDFTEENCLRLDGKIKLAYQLEVICRYDYIRYLAEIKELWEVAK